MTASNICWSCHQAPGDEPFCGACGVIQPPRYEESFYDLFGLDRSFAVDRGIIDDRYRALQQQFHPDRFATQSDRAKRLSLEHVTRINEAHQTLLNPYGRALYLLKLLGREVDGARGNAGESDPAFLMMVMEQREALESVDMAADDAADRLDAVRQEVDQRIVAEERAIAEAFAKHADSGQDEMLESIAGLCDRLRYHNRFLEEVERMEESLFE